MKKFTFIMVKTAIFRNDKMMIMIIINYHIQHWKTSGQYFSIFQRKARISFYSFVFLFITINSIFSMMNPIPENSFIAVSRNLWSKRFTHSLDVIRIEVMRWTNFSFCLSIIVAEVILRFSAQSDRYHSPHLRSRSTLLKLTHVCPRPTAYSPWKKKSL